MLRAPSLPLPTGVCICESVTFLFAKLASLSEMINLSPATGTALFANPFISTVGVTAIGLPAPSKPITWVVVPVRYVSTPVQSVINALFAVKPVRVPPAILSFVLDRVLIELVLPAMSPESVSSAVLIDPDIDPRVNI